MDEEKDRKIAEEYAKFIAITRKHQAERERLKKLALKNKAPESENYYIDISQLDTLVQDNLVQAPQRGTLSQESKPKHLYKTQDEHDRIRAMEMNIDEYFKEKYKELSPYYWPVIPINPRPYLNPIIKDK